MDRDDFPRLIEALLRPAAYPHPADPVEHIETHISHVLLAGDFAYKLKKPLDLGFLDFSTLERRRHCCEEELRLNRRLAADLYLEVVSISGPIEAPRIGGTGPVLEYGVRMRRFPQESLLDRLVLSPALMDRLAEVVADFHASIPRADMTSRFGTPSMVRAPMLENLEQIRSRTASSSVRERVDRLEAWTRGCWQGLISAIEQRRRHGHVRECHGDMHRGNIALIDGEIRIFDAIEFNPGLRWIDTASEIAFLIMDLEECGATSLAQRFLNRYLERCGDYESLELLDFYKVYRALVRAKVLAIRLHQADLEPAEATRDIALFERYLDLAESYTGTRVARLVLACGLSGSGKSHLACQLREVMPLIHLRSDIERKRLFGLAETATTRASPESGIYFPLATQWTYARLLRLADRILGYGYDVLVDATFIARKRRAHFWAMARRRRVQATILCLDAPLDILKERISQRLACGDDASEADLRVLERQCAEQEPLTAEELGYAVLIDTTQPILLPALVTRIETALSNWPAGPRHASLGLEHH